MALNEKAAPKKVGTFIAALALAVTMFVIVLGLSAYFTRYSPRPVAVTSHIFDAGAPPMAFDGGRVGTALEGEPARADGGESSAFDGPLPKTISNGGENESAHEVARDTARVVDAGLASDVDAGLQRRPAFDAIELNAQLGVPLAACIRTALDEDPSAQVRVRIRLRSESERVVVGAIAPGTSPYFRRCAQGLTSATRIELPAPAWFWVDQSGTLTPTE